MSVFSVYVEKKPEFSVEANALLNEIKTQLKLDALESLRIVNRYYAQHLSGENFEAAKSTVFSEPQVDTTYADMPDFGDAHVFAVEYLPGQFDQRADSCAQCISLLSGQDRPVIKTAKIYAFKGVLTENDIAAIKSLIINPVESRQSPLDMPLTLDADYKAADDVKTLSGFRDLDDAGLRGFLSDYGLAMDADDIAFCKEYFIEENRDPTLTEIRIIDTYWSDHCRHTTFLTRLDGVKIEPNDIRQSWREYLDLRGELYWGKDKPITLMDIATIGVKALKARGFLKELDESEEINACSVKIKVDVDGGEQDWLLMFKNETHNHPTEIEPFGGAATCLGGAIRDPLSGRSYVYQAMRITGAGDPTETGEKTLEGKLSQRKIVQTAAAGYSSYGNQIGLSTGLVHEIYHPGYVAKRMELGAVLGAAPSENVVREQPMADDVVILLGGRTGRDGCGGATGSSKAHTVESLESCGAEVQKGNPPEERKIQRLFRNPDATRLIRRCNDFGAGGVAVSIGELADGLDIDLDSVPKKYEGLDGTELAISESQERMSVVIAPRDADRFIKLAQEENLEATVVARVTEQPRLVMKWRGKIIADLSREFLNSNGAEKHSDIEIKAYDFTIRKKEIACEGELIKIMSDIRFCSQKGLGERFDGTIGAGSVLMPFGGKKQLTPIQAMVAKIPVLGGETTTCSVMSWGYSPEIMCQSQYQGGKASVVESVAKLIAAGGSRKRCWLSMQEYFERLKDEPLRWGKPAAALLGALEAQLKLKVGAIGGKDSMSGTFEDIDVPPTLVSFAVGTAKTGCVISPEFKKAGSFVYGLKAPEIDKKGYLDAVVSIFDILEEKISEGKILSIWAVGEGGTAVAVANMCFGNQIGFKAEKPLDSAALTGSFVIEADEIEQWDELLLGKTTAEYEIVFSNGEKANLENVCDAWQNRLESVYPCNIRQDSAAIENPAQNKDCERFSANIKATKPRVLIPVFPGTNCEYDTARAFEKAGAEAEIFVVRNLTSGMIKQSVGAFAKAVSQSQIIAIPGGFSGGDEPDGSAKFITAFMRNPEISEQIMNLLKTRDGLMCGICNGFQALIKLGLLTKGEICKPGADSPTLTYNAIGRHQSRLVLTKVVSNASPWLQDIAPGSVFTVPVSHGEGRFIISGGELDAMRKNGRIATVYVDESGNASGDIRYNPNGSTGAVEGIFSPDGRVFGKMGHNERYGDDLYKNVPGDKFMDMFGGAVKYYG